MQLLYNDYVLACEFYYLLDAHPLARVDGRLEGFLAQLAARADQDGLALGQITGGVDYPQGLTTVQKTCSNEKHEAILVRRLSLW
jgi:hypothetical protein